MPHRWAPLRNPSRFHTEWERCDWCLAVRKRGAECPDCCVYGGRCLKHGWWLLLLVYLTPILFIGGVYTWLFTEVR